MKKFKFKLQSVLNMKIALEKQQKSELAAANQRLLEFQRGLFEINSRFEDRRAEINEKAKEGVSPFELSAYSQGFETLRNKAEAQKKKILVAEEEKERIQKKLIDTTSERKMYEKLKEKQIEEYKIYLRHEEEKEINDFVSNKISAE